MGTPRAYFTLTVLTNGKVLATGGRNVGVGPQVIAAYTMLSSADLYDPVTNIWAAAANMLTARNGYYSPLLPNGKVMLTKDGATTDIYEYSSKPGLHRATILLLRCRIG